MVKLKFYCRKFYLKVLIASPFVFGCIIVFLSVQHSTVVPPAMIHTSFRQLQDNTSAARISSRIGRLSHRSEDAVESGTTKDETRRPTGLRLVMIGDSVDRYQYLSLVYYLRWGTWYSDDIVATQQLSSTVESALPPNYLFHETNGGTWNDFLQVGSRLLHPYESCDCYREGSRGSYQHNRTCENRFYYDDRSDNAVAFFWVPGRVPAQGHWDAATAFGRVNTRTTLSSAFEPFQWQYTSWSSFIRDYVNQLQPKPKWLYFNAHYWPNDFPFIGREVVEAAGNMNTIWSTATVSNNFTAHRNMFNGVDVIMCALTSHCLNQTYWMETFLTRRDMHDFFHFRPHVYKSMNQRLLSTMGI